MKNPLLNKLLRSKLNDDEIVNTLKKINLEGINAELIAEFAFERSRLF